MKIARIFESRGLVLIAVAAAVSATSLLPLGSLVRNGAVPESVFWKQALYVGIGIIFALFLSTLDLRALRRHGSIAIFLYGMAIASLAGVLIFGETVRGTRAWYDIGFFSIAPVEFAKIVVLVVLAKFFSDRHRDLYTVRHIAVSLAYCAGVILLVLAQPDFGSAAVLGVLWLGIVVFSGVRRKWLAALIAVFVIASAFVWMFALRDYQRGRILSFLDPARDPKGSAYHVIQSRTAVGSGGLWGKGFGATTQGGREFLPDASTDFIFAVIAEEGGLSAVSVVLALLAAFWYLMLFMGSTATNNFAKLFVFGYALLLAVHFFVNAGMNLGLVPVVGIPLPFISYGGSHVLAEFMGLGVALAASHMPGNA